MALIDWQDFTQGYGEGSGGPGAASVRASSPAPFGAAHTRSATPSASSASP